MAYKRVSRKTSGGRQTTTFHTGKGATRSSSYKIGTNGKRITTTVTSAGSTVRRETSKGANGYITVRTKTISPAPKFRAPKLPKVKLLKKAKLPKALKIPKQKAPRRLRSIRVGKEPSLAGVAVILIVMFIWALFD